MACNNESLDKIKVLSANCRGLRDKSKRLDVINYLSDNNPDIICLQDTHLMESDAFEFRKFWQGNFILHGTRHNARGVAILFGKHFEYNILYTNKDNEGNMILVDLEINETKFRLINMYGPNTDNEEFYTCVSNDIARNEQDYLIWCGDFNISLNPRLDSNNYLNINNPKNRNIVINTIQEQNLTDLFRYYHPDKKRYTWHKNKPIKQARLDYFITSSSFTDLVTSINIQPGYRSDHSILELSFSVTNFQRGKGTWKLNTSFLREHDFINIVNRCIKDEYQAYAIPVYSPQYLDNLTNNIELKIDYDLFLEVLLLRIRGEAIKYGSMKKRAKNQTEQQLKIEIEQLEKLGDVLNFKELENKKKQLVDLRKNEIQGHFVRSRTQWVIEGEKPTKYFCALECKNYLDKTIKCLKLQNEIVIKNQKEILKEVRNFYQSLFGSRDDFLNEIDFQKLLKGQPIKKITTKEATNLEGYLTVQELSEALKNTKNNKTPGLDGFPAEFFKVFWMSLKVCVTRAINSSFDKGLMSSSLRQCIITCLPKNGKPRENIQNWRPLSMLSVVYKLCSAAIANRIKPLLNKIIDNVQCGFVQGRYIGECTRLVYDILQYTESHQIPGMLVLIDFQKAFDSISWTFIYKTLLFLGFTEKFIQWLKLFNKDVKARVIQSGFLSEPFNIERGCRQGDPISAYLFILCGQILTLLLQKNKEIKGISIGNLNIKVSQFADDTTLILDGTIKSFETAMNTLEIFGSISGLKVNTEKTQIVWIGKKKLSKEKIVYKNQILKTATDFKLLGIHFSLNLETCIHANYAEKISKIRESINQWNKRFLTPLGKVTVIKTFFMSQLNHLITALPDPTDEYLKEINKLFYGFLWSGKPDKINRNTIELDNSLGGIKMVNLRNSITSLKATWIRRLIANQNFDKPLWIQLFEKIYNTNTTKFSNFGTYYSVILKKRSKNLFWSHVFDAWIKVSKTQEVKNADLLTCPLWYNNKMICEDMYLPKWYEKGIITIADVTDHSGSVLEIDILKRDYGIEVINPLHYIRVKQNVKEFLKKFSFRPLGGIEKPFIPFFIKILFQSKKGAGVFNTLIKKDVENKHIMKEKWEGDLDIKLNDVTWKNIFICCYKTLCNNTIIWFQTKLLYRILATRSYLYKINITDNDKCLDCGEKETILHMFVECNNVKNFWSLIEQNIYKTLKIKLTLNKFDIIFGYHPNGQNRIPVNAIILITKKYIHDTKCQSNTPSVFNLDVLKKKFQQTYQNEFYLATINNKRKKFDVIWSKWVPFLGITENITL